MAIHCQYHTPVHYRYLNVTGKLKWYTVERTANIHIPSNPFSFSILFCISEMFTKLLSSQPQAESIPAISHTEE